MNTLFKLACFSAAIGIAGASQAVLIAHWNFNGLSTTGGVPSNANQTAYTPDSGSASLNLVGWTSRAGTVSPHGISNFGGTTVNAVGADSAGQALALQAGGGNSTLDNNGAQMIIQFSMSLLENPIITFATQRTTTGFNANQVSYSTDGTTYTNFGAAYTPPSAFATQTIDLSTVNALDNVTNVYIKLTFGGATAVAGNNRYDNIQINATDAVPEPATLATLALGAIALRRRRR